MNKREEEIRRKLGVTKKAPAQKKMTPEEASKLGNEIHDMAIEEAKRRSRAVSEFAMRPQIMTGDIKGMGLAGAAAGRTITPKQIGRATINAPKQAKRSASSIEQNTQEKGEVEKDDN